MPEELIEALQKIGKRTPVQKIRMIIAQLCALSPLKLPDLVEILQRDSDHLRKHYISKMIDDEDLEYLFPESPSHPQQAYQTKKPRKDDI